MRAALIIAFVFYIVGSLPAYMIAQPISKTVNGLLTHASLTISGQDDWGAGTTFRN